MKKDIKYILEEECALAIKKIIGKIKYKDYNEHYGLNGVESELMIKLFELIQDSEEDEE